MELGEWNVDRSACARRRLGARPLRLGDPALAGGPLGFQRRGSRPLGLLYLDLRRSPQHRNGLPQVSFVAHDDAVVVRDRLGKRDMGDVAVVDS